MEDFTIDEKWLGAVATGLSAKFGVSIKKGQCWQANVHTKEIEYTEDILHLDRDNAIALLLHETGHLLHTLAPDNSTTTYMNYPSTSQYVINLLEDIRIDKKMSKAFDNSEYYLSKLNTQGKEMVKEHLLKLPNVDNLEWSLGRIPEDTDETKGENATRRAEYTKQIKEVKLSKALINAYLKLVGEPTEPNAISDKIAEVCKGVEDYKSTKQVQAVWEKKVFPLVKDLLPTMQEDQDKAKQQAGEGEGESIKSKIKATTKQPLSAGSREKETMHAYSYVEMYNQLKNELLGAKAKYKRIIKDNAFDRQAGSFSSGKLKKRGLYKIGLGATKVFTRKVEKQNKDFVVSLLIDKSGSMSGERTRNATKGLVYMSEVLTACDIPFEISYFADQFKTIKGYNRALDRVEVGYRATKASIGGGTKLSPPVNYMVNSLSEHKSRNKIGIVLTDGDIDKDEGVHIQKGIQKLEKLGNSTVYGVGIECDIKRSGVFGKNTFNIKNSSEILEVFTKIIKKHIK